MYNIPVVTDKMAKEHTARRLAYEKENKNRYTITCPKCGREFKVVYKNDSGIIYFTQGVFGKQKGRSPRLKSFSQFARYKLSKLIGTLKVYYHNLGILSSRGGGNEARTRILLSTNQSLSQLSYPPHLTHYNSLLCGRIRVCGNPLGIYSKTTLSTYFCFLQQQEAESSLLLRSNHCI